MSQINQQIQQIIDKRKLTRLPQIEKEITFLKEVKAKVENLDSVINTVSHQINTKQGSYYIMLQADPTMEARFMAVSTSEVKRLLTEQLQTLENLKKRFSRDAVQITRVRDNILKSKEQKTIQPTKGGHKMVTCQNYVSLFYCQITSCPSDGGIS